MDNNKNELFENYLPGIFFLLMISGAISFSSQLNDSSISWLNIAMTSFGTFLSGIGTIGLFVLAIYQLPYQFEKFRTQKEEDAKLERERLNHQAHIERVSRLNERIEIIAAESLEVTYRIINAMKHISNPFSYYGEGQTESLNDLLKKAETSNEKAKINAEIFAKMFNSRLETCKDDINNFYKTKTKSRIFLDDFTNKILSDVDTKFRELRISATMHISGLQSGKEGRKIDVYNKAYDDFYDINETREKFLEEKKLELENHLKEFIHPIL